MTKESKGGPGLLTGVVIGAVVGAAVTLWLIERSSPGPRRGGLGGRGGDIVNFIKNEIFGGVREYFQQAAEEGKEGARHGYTDVEEKLRPDR